MLDEIIPFRYLTSEQQTALRAELTPHTFQPGDVLIRQGDREDTRVFLLQTGTVEVVDTARLPAARVRLITPGHYFGERAALFGETRSVEIRALEVVQAHSMSGERFLRLIRECMPFAQALGDILRDKQGIFTAFDRFRAELLRGIGQGVVDLKRLSALYRDLEPALHPHVASSDTIDFGALVYAVRRLPANVTRTFVFYLTETLLPIYSDPDDLFTPVPTSARRRAVYEMVPGKNMVLIRDGLSDVTDLLSCLCLYAVEARKIRRRIRDCGGLGGISASELEQLRAAWPEETESRIQELALHHEDFTIEIHKMLNNYNSAHAETWCGQIAAATRELMGDDPSHLPPDVRVHVISSNTHSVTNCLSAWLARNHGTLLAWGEETGHPLAENAWQDRHDLAYALAPDYLGAHAGARERKADVERQEGILPLEGTAFTGIAVQLVDTARLDQSALDPGVVPPGPVSRSLIVNIDYAFGEQAGHIISNLMSLFNRNLSSVSVLGKAGGLQGERGDVLVATGFVEQTGDRYYPLPRGANVDADRLRQLLPDRGIHQGTVLTVDGTLLQNRKMLYFNRHIWKCVGLEMEGSYYLRQILKSRDRGAIPPDVSFRFLYYVSDLPLQHDSNLSARLRAVEGVPPLYAITREVLRGILG